MADSSRYSRLAPDNGSPYSLGALSTSSSNISHHDDNESEDSIPMTRRDAPPRARRAPKNPKPKSAAPRTRYLPTSRRFWADFTMGFADGLTVPFALTAGLSSLGQTDTVVYAGLAEVSAGCISMGIGGYLSARQSSPSTSSTRDDNVEDEDDDTSCKDLEAFRSSGEDHEKDATASPTAVHPSALASRYLAPLNLPADLQQLVMTHIAAKPDTIQALLAAESQTLSDPDYGHYSEQRALLDERESDADDDDDDYVWPVASGLSVALGYLIGGLLPLGPYFFVESVGNGLRWSFAVCIVALFLFGFLRDFALGSQAAADSGSARKTSARQLSWHKSQIPWRRLWKSTFEGLQMVILGAIAAIAAVLCVRMFESEKST
ncbi:vacuolar iron transporter ccc1 [Ophiostoma piceae UAMH 11346]|uniref:Vacuolar iron transporter ccc1 n=1 Tax=Ophiostoma piceae (strain UAMH 11346) TaxID=1262450 RepID=S3CC16_OPHP1|nr:vacuolar iron transporter ccc1 [Ophiostoma piceae UAMH 11346]